MCQNGVSSLDSATVALWNSTGYYVNQDYITDIT